jgi:hypothetical protein
MKTMSRPSLSAKDLVPQESVHMMQRLRLLDHSALFRDRAFSSEDWDKHASQWRYLIEPRILLTACASLAVPLFLTTSVSAGCAIYEWFKPAHYKSLDNLHLTFAYSTVSFALSLLLVFKTNTCYARFWEGV